MFLPDLLGYFISGQMSTEMTIAGTSALMEPSQENWSKQLFQEFSIPTHFLTNLVDAGTVKGTVTPEIASLTGIGPAKLVASVGHDSAAAVAAIPGFGKNSCTSALAPRSAWESKLTSLWYLRPLIRAALRTPAASPAER